MVWVGYMDVEWVRDVRSKGRGVGRGRGVDRGRGRGGG